MNRFGLEPSSLSRPVWETDQGSISHGLDKDALSANARDIGETISAAKSVIHFIRQSGLAAQLSKTVFQTSETTFSTVYLMLKSVHEIYNELCETLKSRREEERMDNIAPDVFDFLISFLEPFYAAQRELGGDKNTTLNPVCL